MAAPLKIMIAQKSVTRRGPWLVLASETGYSASRKEMFAELMSQLSWAWDGCFDPATEGNQLGKAKLTAGLIGEKMFHVQDWQALSRQYTSRTQNLPRDVGHASPAFRGAGLPGSSGAERLSSARRPDTRPSSIPPGFTSMASPNHYRGWRIMMVAQLAKLAAIHGREKKVLPKRGAPFGQPAGNASTGSLQ